MGEQNEIFSSYDEKESLRWFLIRKFIVIMAAVGVVEYLAMMFLNKCLFPAVQSTLLKDVNWDLDLNIFQLFFLFVVLILELILLAMNQATSIAIRSGVSWLILRLDDLVKIVIPKLSESKAISSFTALESAALMLIVVFCVIIILIPFTVAAIWYARLVTHEVQKIQEHREELRREYDRKRNLMISDIAHDLRTPMTTVSGYAKALADGMVSSEEKKQEYLDAIQAKSKRMNDLINLLFEYVKLDSEGFQLNRVKTDLCELARECAAAAYSDMEEKGMDFDIDVPDEPVWVEADRLQMGRVITNLLNNAIRHNESGTTIKLFIQVGVDEIIRLYVADTGKEIDEELEAHLFEPFAMSDSSRNSKGGSGLGLSIAQKVVQMHGWELNIKHHIPGFTKAFCIKIVMG